MKRYYCIDLREDGQPIYCCSSCHEDWELDCGHYPNEHSPPGEPLFNPTMMVFTCCGGSDIVSKWTDEDWKVFSEGREEQYED